MQSDLTNLLFGRVCRRCKSSETAKDKRGKEIWIKDHCQKCYNQEQHKRNNPLRARIDNDTIYFEKEPRTGICSLCKRDVHAEQGITKTCLCIAEAAIDKTTATTNEIINAAKEYCLSCHAKVHAKARSALAKRGLHF